MRNYYQTFTCPLFDGNLGRQQYCQLQPGALGTPSSPFPTSPLQGHQVFIHPPYQCLRQHRQKRGAAPRCHVTEEAVSSWARSIPSSRVRNSSPSNRWEGKSLLEPPLQAKKEAVWEEEKEPEQEAEATAGVGKGAATRSILLPPRRERPLELSHPPNDTSRVPAWAGLS